MKRIFILAVSVLFMASLNSCSTYKNSATTPDDVYYSPGTPVQVTAANGENPEYYSTPNENYVKLRVQDPDKWSYFDDYNYDYYGMGYAPYASSSFGISIGYGTGFYSPCYGGFGYYSPMSYYNSYYAWNSFYNPYYGGVVVINGKNNTTPSYTRMSNFNPSAYQGRYYNTRPASTFNNYSTNSTRSSQSYMNTNPNNNSGRYNTSRPSDYNTSPMRSSPSHFSGGGSIGGGGGGGGMRGGGFSRPGR